MASFDKYLQLFHDNARTAFGKTNNPETGSAVANLALQGSLRHFLGH
jgi:hypothetical protein